MAWVEFHSAKIKRIKKFSDFRKALNWSVNEALGFLGSFWGEVIELEESGDISDWTPEYLCEITGVNVKPEKLWEALVTYNWIDELPNGVVLVHDWLDSAGLYLTRKYGTSNRQKLEKIWHLHGRTYGVSEQAVNKKRTNSEPTLPNQPNLTNHTSGDEGVLAERRTNPDIRRFIDFWYAEFLKRRGSKYHVIPGKDGERVRQLLETYSFDDLCVRAVRFFESDDDFMKQTPTIGAFGSVINRLVPEREKKGLERFIKKS